MEKELKALTSTELLELYQKVNSFLEFLKREHEQNVEEGSEK